MKILKLMSGLSLVLCLTLYLSISGLANGNSGNPVIGEGGMQDNTASGGDTTYGGGKIPSNAVALEQMYAIYPESQGIRISIVDKAGNRVTNSVDIVQENPFALLNGTAFHQQGWDKYNEYFGENKYEGLTKNKSFFFSNGIKTEEYTPATWNQSCVPNAKVNGYDIETHIYEKGAFEIFLNMQYDSRLAELNLANNGVAPTIQMPVVIAGASRLAGGKDLMNVLRSPLGQISSENPDGLENVITVLVNMKAKQANNRGELSETIDYLFKYVDPATQGLIGQDKSKLLNGSGSGSGGPGGGSGLSSSSGSSSGSGASDEKIKISDIIMAKEYKIIVEPLFWDVMSIAKLSGGEFGHFAAGGLPAVCYGTNSYLQKYAYEKSKEIITAVNGSLDENMYNYLFLGQHWRESFIGVESLKLAFEDTDLGIKTIEESGITPKTHLDGYSYYTLASLASGDNYKTVGYSVHIYDRLLQTSDTGTPTWDKSTYPPNNYKPGPSPENSNPDGTPKLPDYPSEGDEYKLTNKDHKFNIVKFYAEKNPDGSYIYKENHTRQQAIHTININDEPNYTVDNYYTSTTFTPPTNPTDDYDIWKTNRAPKNTYEGTKSERLTVKATDPDTTLYIRLVSTPTLTIVKYFPTGERTVEEIPWQPSYDSTEPGYEYEKDKQNPDKPDDIPNNFEDTVGTPGSNPIIPVSPSTRIVYIKYKPVEGDSKITLHQNELAHTFKLEDISSLATLTHSFASKSGGGNSTHYCGGCRHDSDGSWCPGHPCSWQREIVDSNYSYVIENKMDYGSTTFVGSQGAFKSEETGKVDDSGSLGIGGGSTGGLTPNLKFSIYRDKTKDNVTLYPNKNNSVKSELSQIFITAEGYTPQTTRVLDKGQTEWYSSFKVNYQYNTEDNELSWTSHCSYDGSSHGDEGTWNGTPHPALDTLNGPYSHDNNVLTKAYLGQPGKGEKVSSATAGAFALTINGKTLNFTRNLKYKYTGADDLLKGFNNDKNGTKRFFKFYPYTEMEYQTVTDLSNKLAYIVSTNLSEVKDNTSVEVGVYQSGVGDTINLTSEQWSTHARTIQGLKDNGIKQQLLNKSLIPGGAVIKLSTAGPDAGTTPEVWVGFRSYEMSVPDDLKVTLSEDTGVKTTSQAKTDAKTFFNDMKNNLSNYHLEKWIMEGISTNDNDIKSKAKKVSGINTGGSAGSHVVTSFGGNDLSTDKKYYLDKDASDATSSKFDVWNSSNGGEDKDDFEQHVYRIYSDVYGKVTVTRDGSEIVSSNIKADKNLSGLLANPDVKRIDDRVKFVTNFVQSLDFEGGKDREAIPWYYEAHDGIEVVESLGFMQVGFNPKKNAIRSEVVDPKLTGKLENRDDTLNFNSATLNEKTRTVQYKMSSAPTTNPNEPGYVGDFNGEPIVIPQISEILKTRLHYMGNNTVMDLN